MSVCEKCGQVGYATTPMYYTYTVPPTFPMLPAGELKRLEEKVDELRTAFEALAKDLQSFLKWIPPTEKPTEGE